MTQIIYCEPLRPAKTGYRRSWTAADRAVNNLLDTDEPTQPVPGTVKQKVSGIEYNIWNQKYERSWTEVDIEINKLSGTPVQPKISFGWNEDYKRWKTSSDIKLNPPTTDPNPETGLSEQFVTQSLYSGYYVLKETMYPAPSPLVPDEKLIYDEYVSHDICNIEVYIKDDGSVIGGDGNPVSKIFVEDAILCLEDDRDNVFKTEYSFQAIELEDNTTVSHIDYTGDYMIREEDNISLSMEQGGLIEPYGL